MPQWPECFCTYIFCCLTMLDATFVVCLKIDSFSSVIDDHLCVLQPFCCYCVFSQKTTSPWCWKLTIRHWLCYWCTRTCLARKLSSTTLPCGSWCGHYGYPCHAAGVCRWLGICKKATTARPCAIVGHNKNLGYSDGDHVTHCVSRNLINCCTLCKESHFKRPSALCVCVPVLQNENLLSYQHSKVGRHIAWQAFGTIWRKKCPWWHSGPS